LTRLPTPQTGAPPPDWLARSAKWLPLVGLIVGGVCALVWSLARWIWPEGPVAGVVAIAAGVLLTGGLHEDGLADTADGFGGGQDTAQRLAIMKDSHIGTYGVVALILVIGLKAAALSQMTLAQGVAGLLAAAGAGRAACTLLMTVLPYVRSAETSKFASPEMNPSVAEAALALVFAAAGFALLPWAAIPIVLIAAIGAGAIVALIARQTIGGFTGDVLGCVEMVVETVVLLAVAALAGHGG
jgi:adenosylcobinamide-GDP ribazoletransferase